MTNIQDGRMIFVDTPSDVKSSEIDNMVNLIEFIQTRASIIPTYCRLSNFEEMAQLDAALGQAATSTLFTSILSDMVLYADDLRIHELASELRSRKVNAWTQDVLEQLVSADMIASDDYFLAMYWLCDHHYLTTTLSVEHLLWAFDRDESTVGKHVFVMLDGLSHGVVLREAVDTAARWLLAVWSDGFPKKRRINVFFGVLGGLGGNTSIVPLLLERFFRQVKGIPEEHRSEILQGVQEWRRTHIALGL